MDEPDNKYDFLDNEAPDDETVATPEPEPEPEKVEPEKAQAPEPPAPEATTAPDEERVPLAALKAEREKRQKYERELAEYRRKLEEQRPPPNFHEAPEQYVQELLSQQAQALTQRMLGALEAQVREANPDYDEVFAELEEQAQENPALVQQVMSAPNPAMAAYRLGKQLRELKQMQDPEAYRAKIEAEVRAKIEAEYKAKEEARKRAADAIPPDLTAARATKDDDVVPDDSLDSILASRR